MELEDLRGLGAEFLQSPIAIGVDIRTGLGDRLLETRKLTLDVFDGDGVVRHPLLDLIQHECPPDHHSGRYRDSPDYIHRVRRILDDSTWPSLDQVSGGR